MRTLTVATRNRHKTAEIAAMLGPSWLVEDLTAHRGLSEPAETGRTFEENAVIKAFAASSALPGLVLADDSGLDVDALDGAPGVRSARYAGEKATDAANRARLLSELSRFTDAAEQPLTARFRCVIALAQAGKILATFFGEVRGRILLAEAGAGGFGYDPLFVPVGCDRTFAELNPALKNRLSHRGRAMAQALAWLHRP